jgi:hypothetical protein
MGRGFVPRRPVVHSLFKGRHTIGTSAAPLHDYWLHRRSSDGAVPKRYGEGDSHGAFS